MRTLNSKLRNRGLSFDVEAVQYCGKTFRVRSRVDRIINEKTGVMMKLANDCIILEGVTCSGNYSSNRVLSPEHLPLLPRDLAEEGRTVEGCVAATSCRCSVKHMSSTPASLVSVVTSVYNGEYHLRDCIESVLAQTYSNWDYTICNNCSTDRTLDIAREYAAKDRRIRIHNNEIFVDVNENHNIAFRSISPESRYCKVVAADEWIFPECIEKMVQIADQHPSVAIVGSYGLCETKVVYDGLPYSRTVVTGRELFRKSMDGFIWGGPRFFGGPTSLLFRSDIVRSRHAFFDVDNFHADTEACFEFLEHFDFGFVHQSPDRDFGTRADGMIDHPVGDF